MGNKSKHGAGKWQPNIAAARVPKTARSWAGLGGPQEGKKLPVIHASARHGILSRSISPPAPVSVLRQPWQKAAAKHREKPMHWNARRAAREERNARELTLLKAG